MEPHEITTVSRRAVMPPKPQAKIKAPQSEAYLAKLMADDAKAVRKRWAATWGKFADVAHETNEERRKKAEDRREALSARIADFLRNVGEAHSSEIQEALDMSQDRTRHMLRLMKINGVVDFRKGRFGRSIWSLK